MVYHFLKYMRGGLSVERPRISTTVFESRAESLEGIQNCCGDKHVVCSWLGMGSCVYGSSWVGKLVEGAGGPGIKEVGVRLSGMGESVGGEFISVGM